MPDSRGGTARRFARVLVHGWSHLTVTVVGSYLCLMTALVAAGLSGRALVAAQSGLYARGATEAPLWLGVLTYVEGVALTAAAGAFAVAVLLAGAVETTWSVERGERVRPWVPLARGVRRTAPLACGVVVLTAGAAALGVAAIALLFAAVFTLPLALVVSAFAATKPRWRAKVFASRPYRALLIAVAPFGVLVVSLARTALWVPYVVDGAGVRAGLRESGRAFRADRRAVLAPLGVVAVLSFAAGAGALALSAVGATDSAAGVAVLVVMVATIVSAAVVVTLLHSQVSGVPGPPAARPEGAGRRRLLLRRPGVAATLSVAVLAQLLVLPVVWAVPATYTVDTLADAASPVPGECTADHLPCSLRGALAAADAAPGATVRFAVSGTIELVGPIATSTQVTIDGAGQRVKLHNAADGSALAFYGATTAEAPSVLRNVTLDGSGTPGARGVTLGAGALLVDSVTFIGQTAGMQGAAISSNGELTVRNASFSGVEGSGPEGGAVFSFGALEVNHSTFDGHRGGGLAVPHGTPITVTNSVFRGEVGGFNCTGVGTFAGNVSNDGTCAEPGDSGRTNLQSSLFRLGGLGDHGGAVDTFAPGAGSVALGAGVAAHCSAVDARGVARPQAPNPCDAGAYQTQVATSTTITAVNDPVRFGERAMLTVQVHHELGAPSGSVEVVLDDADPVVMALDHAGSASYDPGVLAVGDHTVRATYQPDGELASSSATLTLTVVRQDARVGLVVDPPGGYSAAGEEVTLVATVDNARDAAGPTPTGAVEFRSGDDLVATAAIVDGVATAPDVALDGGLHTLTAVYTGSPEFNEAGSAEVLHAVQSDTAVELQAPAEVTYGNTFEVRTILTPTAEPGAPDPTGSVTVYATTADDTWTLTAAWGDLDGVELVAEVTATLPAGEWDLHASYVGDAHHMAGSSPRLRLTVAPAATTVSLTGPGRGTLAGEPAEFTATVAAPDTSAEPAGQVRFDVDGRPAGTVALDDGVATWEPTDLAVTGTDPSEVVATFEPATGDFAASTSTPVTHRVDRGSVGVELTAPAASVTGEQVSLTAAVSPVAPSVAHATGSVTFRAGSDVLDSVELTEGTATLLTSELGVGAHELTATYEGTAAYASAVATPIAHTVSRATTTLSLAVSADDPAFGTAITFTATVAVDDPGSGAPDGTVELRSGSEVLAEVPLAAGVATYTTSALPAGSHTVVATYAGDPSFLSSAGSRAVSVARATPTVAIEQVLPGARSEWGAQVAVSVRVTSPTGSESTGDVELWWGSSGQVVGTAEVVDGVATVTTDSLRMGRTILGARYLGDANHEVGHSPTGSDEVLTWHEVTKATPRLEVTTETSPTPFGEVVRIHATVEPIHGRVPTGSVRIRLQHTDGAVVTSFDADGHASASILPQNLGEHAVIVNVEEDSHFLAAEAVLSGHRVTPGTATVSLSADHAEVAVGETATFTATVGPAAAAGLGQVTFSVGDVPMATVPVGADGTATWQVSFPTTGVRTIHATYSSFGIFHPASAEPISLTVPGVRLTPITQQSPATYGTQAHLDVFLAGGGSPLVPHPTGTVIASVDGATVAAAPVLPPEGGPTTVAQVRLYLPATLDAGANDVAVTYSGDAVYEPLAHAAVVSVARRATTTTLDAPGASAASGEPVRLSGMVSTVGIGLAPSGTLTLGTDATSCTITLAGGVRGGTCEVVFDRPGTYHLRARYSGDDRHDLSASSSATVTVGAARAVVSLSAPVRGTGLWSGWNDAEPVPVTWSVRRTGTAEPTGSVQVWTHEGRQSRCDEGLTGTCEVRFERPTDKGWVEVRYGGDGSFDAATERASSQVLGCYMVTLAFGTNRTAPNCGGGLYLHGTRVELTAPARDGYSLAGWSFGRDTPLLHDSPVWITDHRFIEPRYTPVCVTLQIDYLPYELPRAYPTPAPNCDDPIAADHTPIDVAGVRRSEVAEGRMRYRAGTEVTLRDFDARAGDLTVGVGFSGDGVASGVPFVMDRDRDVVARMSVPCHRLVVDGAPGTTTEIGFTRYDTSSRLLDRYLSGRCTTPDGHDGFLPGTEVFIAATPAPGSWFTEWGPLEPLGDHLAPEAPAAASDRPANVAVGSTERTSVRMPAHDAAISALTASVSCHPVRVAAKDAVTPGLLDDGAGPARVDVRAVPNCPGWWLSDNSADRSADWFVEGTEVTVEASPVRGRLGWVDGFASPQPITFHRWTGDITDPDATAAVTVTGPVTATAEWYIPATCATLLVRTVPAGIGEVVTSGVGDACQEATGVATVGPSRSRVPIGDTVMLAARPPGALQTIWTFEGPSVVNTQACREREQYIAESFEVNTRAGRSREEVELSLMSAGYLPGYNLARLTEEAERRADQGWTQGQIITHLKALGLLDADGALVPDRLKPNPCDHPRRDVTLPAGQRAAALNVEGDTAATAHFCQAVDPSATIVDVDGEVRAAEPEELDLFAGAFRSASANTNCPIPGWFRPNTTVTLGKDGAGVPGYRIEGWRLDGVDHPAGPLAVQLDGTSEPRSVELIVRVVCHPLKVTARFGYTTYPQPNCPGVDDSSRGLFAEGTEVMVTAGESSSWVWQGWSETGTKYNPVLAEMDEPVTLTAKFREKNLGEKIMDSVIDPALNAVGVAAKKAVGGVAYTVKAVAETLVSGVILTGLSLLGDALRLGFEAMGVQGVVLDAFVLALQTPKNAVDGALGGFDCIQEWAWGRSVPTPGDVKGAAISVVKGEASTRLQGVEVADVIAAARGFADRIAAGDPRAMAEAYVSATGPGGAMTLLLVEDMVENPDYWQGRAELLLERALDALADQFGTPFTWESSAADAWTSGGDEFARCLAGKGKVMFDV